jgi:hypothetical protein
VMMVKSSSFQMLYWCWQYSLGCIPWCVQCKKQKWCCFLLKKRQTQRYKAPAMREDPLCGSNVGNPYLAWGWVYNSNMWPQSHMAWMAATFHRYAEARPLVDNIFQAMACKVLLFLFSLFFKLNSSSSQHSANYYTS